jgi:hypothetical protein
MYISFIIASVNNGDAGQIQAMSVNDGANSNF